LCKEFLRQAGLAIPYAVLMLQGCKVQVSTSRLATVKLEFFK